MAVGTCIFPGPISAVYPCHWGAAQARGEERSEEGWQAPPPIPVPRAPSSGDPGGTGCTPLFSVGFLGLAHGAALEPHPRPRPHDWAGRLRAHRGESTARSAARTVFRDTPMRRAIALTPIPSERSRRRISAQSSTFNTSGIISVGGQFSAVADRRWLWDWQHRGSAALSNLAARHHPVRKPRRRSP